MDNQLGLPDRAWGSKIAYKKLRAAVSEWPFPIYTLLVPYEPPQFQKFGRANMRRLSEGSGGRLFEVSSLEDLAHDSTSLEAFRNNPANAPGLYRSVANSGPSKLAVAARKKHSNLRHMGR
jgi:hypothetical protein